MEIVDIVVARSVVGKIMEDVVSMSAWIISIEEVWKMLQDDQPLQEAIRKKKSRQVLELNRALDDISRDDRLQKGADFKKQLGVKRAERQMVDLGDLMDCLRITMGRETLINEPLDDMEWTVMKTREHEVLDTWWSEFWKKIKIIRKKSKKIILMIYIV